MYETYAFLNLVLEEFGNLAINDENLKVRGMATAMIEIIRKTQSEVVFAIGIIPRE